MANSKIEKCKEKLLQGLLIAEGGNVKDAPNYNHYVCSSGSTLTLITPPFTKSINSLSSIASKYNL